MSMEDLGILANRLIADYPTFYPLFAEEEFPFDGRVPSNSRNRNPVLFRTIQRGSDPIDSYGSVLAISVVPAHRSS